MPANDHFSDDQDLRAVTVAPRLNPRSTTSTTSTTARSLSNPSTKRGFNFPAGVAIGLGWLSLTLRAHSETGRGRLVRDVLDAIGENAPRTRARGLKGYDEGLDVLSTSALGWGAERPREVHLTLKQSDCSWPVLAALLEVADSAESWQVSRLDLNYDDLARRASPADVQAAIAAGDVVTRASHDNAGQTVGGALVSVYVGAMVSKRILNVYDKDVERAKALRKPVALGTYGIRWELRVKDKRAMALVAGLRGLDDAAGLVNFFWRQVAGLVDFRSAPPPGGAGHHYEKRQRLGWWAELVDSAEREAAYGKRAPEDEASRMWRKLRWLTDCAPAIAEVADWHPNPSLLRELVSIGAERNAQKRDQVERRLLAV